MTETAPPPIPVLERLLFPLVLPGLMGSVLFATAGRWDLWAMWAYVSLWVVSGYVASFTVSTKDPSLWQERKKPGPGGKDPHLRLLMMPLLVLHSVIAGLDAGRYHWSGEVPVAAQVAGLTASGLALAVVNWAISVNRFFSSDARIQRERGHHVITGGPYQFIRHPGYAAVLVWGVFGPLALGSYWSALPLLLGLLLVLRRVLIEDRLLREELKGYADYASRVPYRLVPGLW